MLVPSEKRRRQRRGVPFYGVDTAGRWAILQGEVESAGAERTERIARVLLNRYGVVFRSLLARESNLPTWRELVMVYRRMEARGEIRGGRFVRNFGGEQFALPDAVGRLRSVRKLPQTGEIVTISAADPLNLVGVITPDARVPAIPRNRVLFRDGIALAALEAGEVRRLAENELDDDRLRAMLVRRNPTIPLRSYTPTEEKRESWLARTRRQKTS